MATVYVKGTVYTLTVFVKSPKYIRQQVKHRLQRTPTHLSLARVIPKFHVNLLRVYLEPIENAAHYFHSHGKRSFICLLFAF